MRIIDRHIIRELLSPLLICLLAFLMVAVVQDLNDNLEDFTSHDVPARQICWYYLLNMPRLFVLVAPLSILLGVLYLVSNMARHHELIGMRAGGLSLRRAFLPVYLVGSLASIAVLGLSELLAPEWTRRAEDFRRFLGHQTDLSKHVRQGFRFDNEAAHRLWMAASFSPVYDPDAGLFPCLEEVTISETTPDGVPKQIILAERAEWLKGRWHFIEATIQPYMPDGKTPDLLHTRFSSLVDTLPFDETPRDFLLFEERDPENMSMREIRQFLARHQHLPRPTDNLYRVTMYHRLAYPWTCLASVFIGIPFALRTGRRGPALAVASSLLLFGMLYLLTHVSFLLGSRGFLQPPLAAWLPNLVFLAGGVTLLPSIR